MIQIPVSPRIAPATWPRPGVPDYLFSVHSFGGQPLGKGIHEYDWTLEVDSRRGLLSLESFRSDGDVPGHPPGLFRQILDDAQLKELHKLIVDANLPSLKPSMKQHPGYTERLYQFGEPGRETVRLTINNSDEETNATIAPLRNRLNMLFGKSYDHPERSVNLTFRHLRQPLGDVFEISIANNGLEKVCFSDPRWIANAGPLHRAVMLVTEYPVTAPGDPPPFFRWVEIPLMPFRPIPQNEPLVTLQPGSVWQGKSAIWKRIPGKRYIAYFRIANFNGEPMVNGVYRIRGMGDSKRQVIE